MNLKPFRHAIVDDLFSEAFARGILAEWPPFETGHYHGDNGEPGLKSQHDQIRSLGPSFIKLDRLVASLEFRRKILEQLGLNLPASELLYDSTWFGGGCHENRSGQRLTQHIDFNQHPAQEHWARRVNLIWSLNRDWSPEWGGCLELHSDPLHPSLDFWTTVVPSWNRGVLFEAGEESWHGFQRIDTPHGVSRKTIACYYYVIREVQPHSTIYMDQS